MTAPTLQRAFVQAPRWLLLATLIYAPWAYGCTRQWSINVLNRLMLVTVGLWLLGCVARRLKPMIHPVLLVGSALLFLQGWWMIVNAQYFYDKKSFRFVPIACLWSAAPGVVDIVNCVPAMVRLTALLGIACFVCDLSQRPEWRRRLWWTIGLCGASLVFFGLVERILGAPMIFWETGRISTTFFATYFYHANAGAFINLVFPPIAGLALVAFRTRDANLARAIWFPSLLIVLAGAVTAASKAAIVITVLMVLILLLWRSRILADAWRSLPSRGLRLIAAASLVVLVFSLGWLGWDRMMSRWTREEWVSQSYGSRILAYHACLKMLPDSGLWGFGPGNFMILFPHYTNEFGNAIEGFWRFAHEDYLQTLIEWGWIGAGIWAVVLFGGLATGVHSYGARTGRSLNPDQTFLFTTLLALGGVMLHATLDFPLQIASLQFYVAVFVGIAWGSGSWSPRAPVRPSRNQITRSGRAHGLV